MSNVMLVILVLTWLGLPVAKFESYLNMGRLSSSSGDCFKDFEYLRQRFSFEQLNFFCQQFRAYNDLIAGDNSSIGVQFTSAQQKYLDSLKLDLNATAKANPYSIRKELRAMSEDERLLFQVAVRSLKWEKIDGISKYDLLVLLHNPALAPGAYVGAAFLPWHREYIRTFERALQQVNAYVTVPYWDTTLDTQLPNPSDSIIFTDLFLGSGEGVVDDGPFTGWTFELNGSSVPLARNLSGGGRLMTQDDVDFMLSQTRYRQFSACVDLRLEQTSRYVHEWVGGCMAELYYSAQDPVFFLYHAFLDYVWEEWRQNRTPDERLYGYPPNYEACTKYHYASSPMSPFQPLTNVDGFSEVYTNLYYSYQKRPNCSKQQSDGCHSNYLFCNPIANVCMSKIKEGGECTGFNVGNVNSCYRSKCYSGRCAVNNPNDTLTDFANVEPDSMASAHVSGLFSRMEATTNSTFLRQFTKKVEEHRNKMKQNETVKKGKGNI